MARSAPAASRGDNERLIARELRKQGLTPVYVGVAPKSASIEIKLPTFGGNRRTRRPLLHSGTLDSSQRGRTPGPRPHHHRRADRTRQFRFIVLDVLRVLKGGRSLADSLATHPEYFSDLYINMVRAGEASGALATIFERLAEFERTRDDLRSYIVSSMIYPALLALRRTGLHLHPAEFRGAAVCRYFRGWPHEDSGAHAGSCWRRAIIVQTYWWMAALAIAGLADCLSRLHPHRQRAPLVGWRCGSRCPCWAMRC